MGAVTVESFDGVAVVIGVTLDGDKIDAEGMSGEGGRAGTGERVEHDLPLLRVIRENGVNEFERFLSWVNRPVAHEFAAVDSVNSGRVRKC